MYGDGNFEKYGCPRYGNNDVFENRDNVWLQHIMVHMFNHEDTMGIKYKNNIDGNLRNEILDRVAKKAIKKYGKIRDISKMTYHRLNQGTSRQDADTFEAIRNSKEIQFTEIVPFTKFDAIIESKNGHNFLMNNKRESVHCFIPSRSCVIFDENIRHCIPDNTAKIERR